MLDSVQNDKVREDFLTMVIRFLTEEGGFLSEGKAPDSLRTCLFCRFFDIDTKVCTKGEDVTDYRNQVCEKWRYAL